ncbi:class I SAM-dependent methyltransferase [Plantactinospora sp. KBS50]|uniref:class I SAM-dependent methyltransferase n=1 Tax=Plantactinospora sp. KBS50 TaxID=2024580 RepID=UPI000BAAF881|nr:class I SAM-dependent methyltransferase [Plantactinospora sp. KBS50]ASW57008.1 SAM-dependent methyltransferase [Plantactinospora sp. KBS50]
MTEQALSFGAAATEYDRFRPPYPADAVRWALAGCAAGSRVVDLGAGTGILSRAVLAIGHRVTPVEPDPGMRTRLAAATPGTTPLAGTAEDVPLPDESADAVLAGQAYHWFDRERAHREIARVLRRGGTFAPIWNTRDERIPWLAELGRVMGSRNGTGDLVEKITDFGSDFGPVELAQFTHSTTLRPQEVVGMAHTRSSWLTAGPDERAGIDRDLHTLLTTHPDLAGRATIELPYRTLVFRSTRR